VVSIVTAPVDHPQVGGADAARRPARGARRRPAAPRATGLASIAASIAAASVAGPSSPPAASAHGCVEHARVG
jgi:hypothetical protein